MAGCAQFVGGKRPMMVKGIGKCKAIFRSPSFTTQDFFISGITKDSTGTPLGICVCDLFRTETDIKIATTVSDSSGNYLFQVQPGISFYIVAYKAGAPDLAGTTVNTLAGI
jgi:hypothetical protein